MSFGNVHLTPQLVQAVRDATDILDVAGEVTSLKRRGKRYLGLCPFHKEKTPSFSVDPAQGLFYCFGCGVGGDAIKLAMHHSGDDFPAVIESLARRYGIPLPSTGTARRRPQGADPARALELAEAYFRKSLAAHGAATDYLRQRQIPDELIERYGIGYAPDGWQALVDELRAATSAEELEAAGLAGRSERGRLYSRFRDRLMFPIANPAGRLVGFGGRTMGADRAKYVNTNETDRFRKSELLYGFHLSKLAIRELATAVLVEGYFDVLAMAASGIGHAVAAMGTSLTEQQTRILARYCDSVVIVYDGDPAGRDASRRALPMLLAAGLAVRRVDLPAGSDPDTFRLEHGPAALRELIESAPDAVELVVDELVPAGARLQPAELSRRADELVALLGGIRDPMVRYAYAQRGGRAHARAGRVGAGTRAPVEHRGPRSADREGPENHPITRGARAHAPPGGEADTTTRRVPIRRNLLRWRMSEYLRELLRSI